LVAKRTEADTGAFPDSRERP